MTLEAPAPGLWTPSPPALEVPSTSGLEALSPETLAQISWRFTPTGYGARLGRLVHPPHVELLGSTLAQVAAGAIDRLIVTMPPRHAKSTTISEWFPAWYLDLHPSHKVLLGSYGAEFASEWGWKVRNILKAHRPHLRVRLAPDFAARNAWYTTEGGGMFTAGVGGPFTGRGGNVIVIDDPFKGWADAHSKAMRDRVWNWYLSVIYTRYEPGMSIVICMTRWHEDDLVGRLLADEREGGDKWHLLRLPAIAEDPVTDPLGRSRGEALWPARHPLKKLLRAKRVMGSYLFNGLYQQRPSPEEGSILKRGWWRWYSRVPQPHEWDELVQSWDLAFKDAEESSYVVGQVWGRIGADKYLLDQVRDHLDFPATVKMVRALSAKWPDARAVLIEDKANGPAVISTLTGQIPGLVAVSPRGSKESRAHAITGDLEAGNLYLPDPALAPWVYDFVEECATFPNGTNDDQVDALTQAILRMGTETLWDTTEAYVDARLTGRR